MTDPADGPLLLAKHTYATQKAYTITVAARVTTGNCTATSSVHTFTLLKLYNDGQDWAKCQNGSCTIAIDHQRTLALIAILSGTTKLAVLTELFRLCNIYTSGSVVIRGACLVFATGATVDSFFLPGQLGDSDLGHGVYITWLTIHFTKLGITPQK